jgi:hypothetical protein
MKSNKKSCLQMQTAFKMSYKNDVQISTSTKPELHRNLVHPQFQEPAVCK